MTLDTYSHVIPAMEWEAADAMDEAIGTIDTSEPVTVNGEDVKKVLGARIIPFQPPKEALVG
jgi:hypothetical protein